MNDIGNNNEKELSEAEGLKRFNDKVKELKKRNITRPVDSEEPAGLLFGGSEHLDYDDESEDK